MDGSGKNSPLDLIRQKERELSERLREAQNSAERTIARAREHCAGIQKSAEEEAMLRAEGFFQSEMKGVAKAVAGTEAPDSGYSIQDGGQI